MQLNFSTSQISAATVIKNSLMISAKKMTKKVTKIFKEGLKMVTFSLNHFFIELAESLYQTAFHRNLKYEKKVREFHS